MSDSIRTRIIAAMVTRAAAIRTAGGFNVDLGANALRAVALADADQAPAVSVLPQPEEVESWDSLVTLTMPVTVDAIAAFTVSQDANAIAEQMLADLVEAFTCTEWTVAFDEGAIEIEVGDTLTGGTSGATGYVGAVDVTAGAWSTSDAAGTLTLRRAGDTVFQDGENLLDAAEAVAAVVDGDPSGQAPAALWGGGLISAITYTGGGQEDFPDPEAAVCGVSAGFNVTYKVAKGNPYATSL